MISSSIPWWAFLVAGILIGASTAIYIFQSRKDGTIHVKERPDKATDVALFEFDISPRAIPTMKQVVFKVVIDPPEQNSEIAKNTTSIMD